MRLLRVRIFLFLTLMLSAMLSACGWLRGGADTAADPAVQRGAARLLDAISEQLGRTSATEVEQVARKTGVQVDTAKQGLITLRNRTSEVFLAVDQAVASYPASDAQQIVKGACLVVDAHGISTAESKEERERQAQAVGESNRARAAAVANLVTSWQEAFTAKPTEQDRKLLEAEVALFCIAAT